MLSVGGWAEALDFGTAPHSGDFGISFKPSSLEASEARENLKGNNMNVFADLDSWIASLFNQRY